ncbi:hypothetical protein JHK82_032005 [Glycine max]|nr:hypothetical protein JHK82_032005 [Glycine max]
MGFSQDPCTDSNAPTSTSSTLVVDHYCDYDKLKFKTFLRKMFWEFGLACVANPSQRRRSSGDGKKTNMENNKAWLLAESGGCGAELTNADPQSVHSSFRFSFCSQVELESLNMSSSAAATVLMVNLDNGVSESRANEMKWRRMESLEKSISPVAHTLIRFSYGEIMSATRNFSKGRVLGRGALSCVFRGRVGILRTAVAIKRLDKEDKESAKAFCRELMIASSLHSSNVVPLLGFCIDPEEGLFLVYKYVSGGSLERHLHGRKKGSSPLPWPVRYKVAIGIAEAVAYLHSGTERCVVHRDIKPSNILLSSRKTPKAKPFLQKGKGAIEELLDPQLKCSLKFSNQMGRMIEAAAACVTNEESRRPGIREIIAILKGEEEPLLSKRKKSSFLGNGCVIDCYSQLQQTNNEMKSHLALAMLGVAEFEDDDYLYGR